MALVGRLAGAILAETEGQFFLVGNPKEPCDFSAAGFEPPGVINAMEQPFIRLSPLRPVQVPQPYLTMTVEGEGLARLLVDRFVIQRNGSVSDRLWRLVTDPQQEHRAAASGTIDARWLGEIPAEIWRIVRETVLKCT
ncbi:MAG: precorrin-3B C(17)-methyltransferase [Proteobacteria bacterium HN_bin10]|nr:MAG: precorrin-3B C(17)-methyltransferase [Proteobacteria bacterium HN_bin10]